MLSSQKCNVTNHGFVPMNNENEKYSCKSCHNPPAELEGLDTNSHFQGEVYYVTYLPRQNVM